MSLVLHRGAELVKRDTLATIEVPQPTDTYTPVPHNQLVDTLSVIGQDILTGHTLLKEQFALARDGKQMFGVLVFQNGNSSLGLSIGFRNSYDKSMAIGIAIGASVFICDNLALSGDITVLKKHTQNVWQSLEDVAIATLYRSQQNYQNIISDSERMKTLPLEDEEAFKTLGLLYGKGVLSPRQIPAVKREWEIPSHDEFKDRNTWSFYNACTEALKSCPPLVIMEKHISLHNVMCGKEAL